MRVATIVSSLTRCFFTGIVNRCLSLYIAFKRAIHGAVIAVHHSGARRARSAEVLPVFPPTQRVHRAHDIRFLLWQRGPPPGSPSTTRATAAPSRASSVPTWVAWNALRFINSDYLGYRGSGRVFWLWRRFGRSGDRRSERRFRWFWRWQHRRR